MTLLWIFTLVLLLFCLLTQNGRYIAPATLFCVGFLICFSVALVYQREWSFVLHETTMVVVCAGLASFLIGTGLASLFFRRNHVHSVTGVSLYNLEDFLPIRRGFLAITALLSAFAFAATAIALLDMFPGNGIMAAMGSFNNAAKFSEAGALAFPRYILILRNVTLCFGYIACFLLAQQIALKKKDAVFLLLLQIVLTMAVSIQNGARSGAIGYLVVFFVCYGLIRFRFFGTRPVAVKFLLVVALLSIVFILGFQASLALLGRQGGNLSFFDYLSVYCGAQLPNLDVFITSGHRNPEIPWGGMTFATTYRDLANWLGFSGYDYSLDLPFLSRAGRSMGNVYTTFYSFYYDFGIEGVILLSSLAGFLSQLVFRWACFAKGKIAAPLAMTIYGLLAYNILLSFFTNRLYESFFCVGILRSVIYISICLLVYVLIGARRKHEQS